MLEVFIDQMPFFIYSGEQSIFLLWKGCEILSRIKAPLKIIVCREGFTIARISLYKMIESRHPVTKLHVRAFICILQPAIRMSNALSCILFSIHPTVRPRANIRILRQGLSPPSPTKKISFSSLFIQFNSKFIRTPQLYFYCAQTFIHFIQQLSI